MWTVPADVPTTGPNARRGEKPPVMPLAARRHTRAGARAFAVFFIETIDWAYASTSTSYMRHYVRPSCIECRNVADAIDRDRAQDHHFLGGRFTVRHVAVGYGRNGVCIQLTLAITAVEVVTARGNYVGAEQAHAALHEDLFLQWFSPAWLVVRMVPR
jgi:hypothetical protein